MRFFFFTFVSVLLVASGCSNAAEKIRCSERNPKTGQANFGKQSFSAGTVNYHGVSFSFDSSLGEVAAEIRCAVTDLNLEKGIFYEYHPEHPAFVFNGDYANQLKGSFFSKPEIRIYPVNEYLEIVGQNADLKRIVEEEFRRLKDSLGKQPTSFTYEAPFVAVLEAGQLFQAKVKYLSFKAGKGILYLTWFCNDPTQSCEITSQGLSYIFQGLTDDGRYFIYATFPVKTALLPLKEKIPDVFGCFDPKSSATFDELTEACQKYGKQVGNKIDLFASADFYPSLDLFDQLIQSLSITSP
ncbi:MAG: hypothetical protein JNK38_00375 [Acidobacteria bacterium]|nr:hypothetical protein [Acidobacteriota bacterium]